MTPVSGDTNYPPGVTGAEPYFHDDPDAPCANCGHAPEDHLDGACAGEGRETTIGGNDSFPMTCDCTEYIPYDEENQHGY